jgi:hypothetical protein
MALYRFRNLDRYGRYRTKIFHHPDGEDFKYPKKGLGPFVAVSKFKYEYRGLLPPSLITRKKKKYIVPGWTPVLKETTLNDIKWIK